LEDLWEGLKELKRIATP
jgi:hypothetical protein